MATYRAIRNSPVELMDRLDEHYDRFSDAHFLTLREKSPKSAVERAARFIFLNKTCFNGLYRTNSKGRFNVPFGKQVRCPALYDRDGMLRVSERLNGAELVEHDFETLLDAAGPGDLVYCDPPYAPISPTACFSAYTPNGFNWRDHERLKSACTRAMERGASIVVCNSDTPLVRDLYRDWDFRIVQAPRNINSNGEKRGEVTELILLSPTLVQSPEYRSPSLPKG